MLYTVRSRMSQKNISCKENKGYHNANPVRVTCRVCVVLKAVAKSTKRR